MKLIRRIYNPSLFQGVKKRRNYFEGWYHKHAPIAGGTNLAVIPGVAYDERGRGEAFIQVIHGVNTAYIRYPIEDFRYDTKHYGVYVGPNRFSLEGMDLHIDRPQIQLFAELRYANITPLQGKRITSPGIMGWYRFVPAMECYHGVVSLDHTVLGSVQVNGSETDYTGGRGYIEKDWGKSMPSAWIWFQTNSFSEAGSSTFFSLANIPWIRRSFAGFLAVCHTPAGQYRFATYNGARIRSCTAGGGVVTVVFSSKTHELTIQATYAAGGELIAPRSGKMERTIKETIDAQATVTLKTIDGYILFEDRARSAGLEMVGDIDQLIANA